MYQSTGKAFVFALTCILTGQAACDSRPEFGERGAVAGLDRTAWLGSAEGWGILGLPLDGGALTYRSAESLESPTWAPPDFGVLEGVWPGVSAIWIQFPDSGMGKYDYSTGHLLSVSASDEAVEKAVALENATGLVVGRGQYLDLIGGSTDWRFDLGGSLIELRSAQGGTVVAMVDHEQEVEFIVLSPPAVEPEARRRVNGTRDFVVTAWGTRLYYLPVDAADTTVIGLTLPELENAETLFLPEAGTALAATPSSHRIYVAAGGGLHVFQRLSGMRIGEIAMPGSVSALRFGFTGTNLLALLEDANRVAVLQVGIDSILGTISADWGDHLPVALSGGRIVARHGAELVLYSLPSLAEIGRVDAGESSVWLPLAWNPPQPRPEAARRAETDGGGEATDPASRPVDSTPGDSSYIIDPERGAPPGYYAVVSAARSPAGVDNLVRWLRSVGYTALRDRHEDVMGVIWFRAMLGPYANRSQAESSARSLSARYGYKPWILSIDEGADGPPTPADTVSEMSESGGEDREDAGESESIVPERSSGGG